MIELFAGTAFALLTVRRTRISAWARHRAVFPLLLSIIALVYLAFGLASHEPNALRIEAEWVGLFLMLALIAYFGPRWLVGVFLIGHGGFDLYHGHLVNDPSVPHWYPLFCASYDWVLAAFILAGRATKP